LPEERTVQFLVLRSGSAADQGVVIGDPLTGTARQYQDLYVSSGKTYFYRLVAVDAAGNRSDVTGPVIVRVGLPAIPKPAPPLVKAAGQPSSGITLQFDPAPTGLSAVVERQDAPSVGWLRVAGPIEGTTATDYPPAGSPQAHYRILYISASGETGDPSDPVALAGSAAPAASH
jgi:hypothetical protein